MLPRVISIEYQNSFRALSERFSSVQLFSLMIYLPFLELKKIAV